jgi:putative oligomerization/nucleic acid binding protein
MFRRRRPLARAAIVGGAAYAAGKHVQRGREAEAYQDEQIAELQQQQQPSQYAAPQYAAPAAPAEPAGPSGEDAIAALERLAKLKEQGVLTDVEFEIQKQKLLQRT